MKTNPPPGRPRLLVFTATSSSPLFGGARALLDCKNAFKSDELLKAASEERGREREREEREREQRALKSLAVTATSIAL